MTLTFEDSVIKVLPVSVPRGVVIHAGAGEVTLLTCYIGKVHVVAVAGLHFRKWLEIKLSLQDNLPNASFQIIILNWIVKSIVEFSNTKHHEYISIYVSVYVGE